MYKIITPTGEQFLTEKGNYIRVHRNGVYLLTDVNHAEGVAHHGTPYLFKDGAPMPPLTIIRAKRHRGQMLRELERLSANGQSMQLWLMEIFRKLAKNLKSAGRWLRRNR